MRSRNFRSLVQAVLLSAGPIAAIACSSDAKDGIPATEMPEQATCVDLWSPSRYRLLTVAPPLDGVAFATRDTLMGSGSDAAVFPALESVGTPCATASDHDACVQKVTTLLASPEAQPWQLITAGNCGGCPREGFMDVGVVTAGDDVRLVTQAELFAAAAPVETLGEASAIVAISGWPIACGVKNARTEADGTFTFQKVNSSCSGARSESFLKVSREGTVSDAGSRVLHEADNDCIEGRRPANLVASGSPWLSSLTACFAEIAHMETASIRAFDDLEADLRALDAPTELVTRVRRARADEVAHAAVTTSLARRFGAEPLSPRYALRTLSPSNARFQLALENAAEGCVREAYGAVIAAWQAAHAQDPEVRAAFTKIAFDETEHAELSFAIDAWLDASLTHDERRQVEAAKTQAWNELANGSTVEPTEEVVRVAGMPSAARALALLESLHDAVHHLAA